MNAKLGRWKIYLKLGWVFLVFSRIVSAHVDQKMSSFLHSHNDYEQEKPLLYALSHQFDSVEVDIWWSRGEIKVSHLGIIYSGSLEDLYLKPLQERVARYGSVYGNSRPFYLWLDFKENHPELKMRLSALLNQYEILFKDRHTFLPVQIVLTGDEKGKREFFMSNREWPIALDRNDFIARPSQDVNYTWYSLDWREFFSWNGQGQISTQEKRSLTQLVEKIHNQNKKIRFFGTPETYSTWSELIRAKVDMLGTDHIQKLRNFIDSKPEVSYSWPQRSSEWARTWETFGQVFQGSYSALIFKN